jgi:hypothetical protein
MRAGRRENPKYRATGAVLYHTLKTVDGICDFLFQAYLLSVYNTIYLFLFNLCKYDLSVSSLLKK